MLSAIAVGTSSDIAENSGSNQARATSMAASYGPFALFMMGKLEYQRSKNLSKALSFLQAADTAINSSTLRQDPALKSLRVQIFYQLHSVRSKHAMSILKLLVDLETVAAAATAAVGVEMRYDSSGCVVEPQSDRSCGVDSVVDSWHADAMVLESSCYDPWQGNNNNNNNNNNNTSNSSNISSSNSTTNSSVGSSSAGLVSGANLNGPASVTSVGMLLATQQRLVDLKPPSLREISESKSESSTRSDLSVRLWSILLNSILALRLY